MQHRFKKPFSDLSDRLQEELNLQAQTAKTTKAEAIALFEEAGFDVEDEDTRKAIEKEADANWTRDVQSAISADNQLRKEDLNTAIKDLARKNMAMVDQKRLSRASYHAASMASRGGAYSRMGADLKGLVPASNVWAERSALDKELQKVLPVHAPVAQWFGLVH